MNINQTYVLNFSANRQDSWNEYLAGLIDGDGSLLVSKKGYPRLEITMDSRDKNALEDVQQKLGGFVRSRSGAKAYRYRLHNKVGILGLIQRINGRLRNSQRVPQLQKICHLYNIAYKEPSPLTRDSAWFAGFFDADGTVGYSIKRGYPQLVISVSNKYEIDLLPFREVFGGFVRKDSATNSYKWDIYSQKDILLFSDYLLQNFAQSHKKKKLFMVKQFYVLKKNKAYSQKASFLLQEEWRLFEREWGMFE
uniref:Putative LAGLIDADG homing endonuclease n=1 Tax=Aphanochaete confervicola TaxID=764104 RepID=A0A6H1XE00_9CHLO|nr:putative LAGLIDADG homing endonuclease [Aphanochaete confervicola]QJA13881.1 putative LAGLIDADG homing endonuclease [Aphanochaete confervicola]